MKTVLVLLGGAVVTALVDVLIGVNTFQQAGIVFSIVHKVMYVGWGAAIAATVKK